MLDLTLFDDKTLDFLTDRNLVIWLDGEPCLVQNFPDWERPALSVEELEEGEALYKKAQALKWTRVYGDSGTLRFPHPYSFEEAPKKEIRLLLRAIGKDGSCIRRHSDGGHFAGDAITEMTALEWALALQELKTTEEENNYYAQQWAEKEKEIIQILEAEGLYTPEDPLKQFKRELEKYKIPGTILGDAYKLTAYAVNGEVKVFTDPDTDSVCDWLEENQ